VKASTQRRALRVAIKVDVAAVALALVVTLHLLNLL
jgi:hypothetical protein